ncbi:MAG: large conductance mechanosensitive channel protein MscL [Candidatus Limivicinus sp.]|nr:large conductance mechanosensitive channel protein MscL [Candidatus Limivicinus sp.]
MKKLIEEFKKFIMRGNVLDMAIGVVIATAFGKITSSLVNDLLMPFISWICGSRDMSALNIVLRPAEVVNGEMVNEAIIFGLGSFVGTVIDFLLIALVVFLILKAFNKASELSHRKAEEEDQAQPPKPTAEELLTQILEEIKSK